MYMWNQHYCIYPISNIEQIYLFFILIMLSGPLLFKYNEILISFLKKFM